MAPRTSTRRRWCAAAAAAAAVVLVLPARRQEGPSLATFLLPGGAQAPPPASKWGGSLRNRLTGSELGEEATEPQRAASSDGEGSRWWAFGLSALAAACVVLGPLGELGQRLPGAPAPAYARTTSAGSRVNRDPISLLQLALPLEEILGEGQVSTVRSLQGNIESIKGSTTLRLWERAGTASQDCIRIVSEQRQALLKPVPAERKEQASTIADQLAAELPVLSQALQKGQNAQAGTEPDEKAFKAAQESAAKCQLLVGAIEELMVPADYRVPVKKEISDTLPVLQGRATVDVVIKHPPGMKAKSFAIDSDIYPQADISFVVDGWSMPVSAGNFVDLVDRGFYKGMAIQRADGFIIQSGDSGPADENGFRPAPGQPVRRVPLELAIKGKKEALYGKTIDEARLVGAQVKVPFQADGTISLARAEFENDSASSQFFLFLFESDMTPAGKNFLDGRYASFGYCVKGAEFLRTIQQGDIIEDMKVTQGLDKLIRPS